MISLGPCRVSRPLYLRAKIAPAAAHTISLREHLAWDPVEDKTLPLVLLTLHPGFAAGSYEDRDYFELISPLLFAMCREICRLRIYTVNHPGYDLSPKSSIHRFRLDPYSIDGQPASLQMALRWLLGREFGDEDQIYLVAYGHSMGGLALAQCNLQELATDVSRRGPYLQVQKVLSAPALVLSQEAKKIMGRLDVLDALKRSLGRLPLYDQVATGLYRALAPILFRLSAKTYSLNADDTFLNFGKQNPFLLLEQGRELLRLAPNREQLEGLLQGSHLILCDGDKMVDTSQLRRAAEIANETGVPVSVHTINSSHNAEREAPQLVAERLHQIIVDMLGV